MLQCVAGVAVCCSVLQCGAMCIVPRLRSHGSLSRKKIEEGGRDTGKERVRETKMQRAKGRAEGRGRKRVRGEGVGEGRELDVERERGSLREREREEERKRWDDIDAEKDTERQRQRKTARKKERVGGGDRKSAYVSECVCEREKGRRNRDFVCARDKSSK